MEPFKKSELQIYTLGRFEIRRGEELISQEEQRLNKRWRLFQLLITFKGKALSAEQMYKYLSLEESVNPGEALKSLAFYLRKSLKGNGDQGVEEPYIICSQGRYYFNENSNYWLDAEEFEKLCNEAFLVAYTSHEKAIELFERALSLYKGNYLGDVPHSYWTIPLKNHYRELYLRAMLAANELLRKSERHEKAWELCEDGLRIIPFEEKLHTCSIQALMDANKHGLALVQYEEAETLFSENGLNVPSEMKRLGDKLKRSEKVPGDPDSILEQLQGRRKDGGAYESDIETFSAIFELEKSRSERGNSSGYLVALDLNGPHHDSEFKKAEETLKKILKTNLRKGDVICGWGPRKILVLLFDASPGGVEKIVERVGQKLSGEIDTFSVDIQSNWKKI